MDPGYYVNCNRRRSAVHLLHGRDKLSHPSPTGDDLDSAVFLLAFLCLPPTGVFFLPWSFIQGVIILILVGWL